MALANAGADSLFVGDHVRDIESESLTDDRATLLVVGIPPRTISQTSTPGGKSIADLNPTYDPHEPVVRAVYCQRTMTHVNEAREYSFPRSRLELVAPIHRPKPDADS